MIRWGLGWRLALSLLVFIPQCNFSEAGTNLPPLPVPPAGPTLQVALLSPASGELATFGRELRNGSILAFDEWNRRGGVLGRRIEWVVYDTDCTFEAGRQVTQQAIADGFQFIIGPLCSDAAIAAADVAEAQGVLLLAPTAIHPLVTVNGQGRTRPTVFRASYVSPFQTQAAARFAVETLGKRRAALFFDPGDDYSAALGTVFSTEFTAQGGQIVYQFPYSPADTDFTPALQAAVEAGAEIIYLPVPGSVANRIAGQQKQLPQSGQVTLLGSDSWDAPELDRAAAEGSYFTRHFFLDEHRPAIQTWADTYKAAYAVAPDTLAALGYDAAAILMKAIEGAGSVEVKRVADTLAQDQFEAVTGPMRFDGQHNPVKPVPVVQIKDGEIILAGYIDR